MIACKLYHQIVIAIFKGLEQGYITENSNLKFSSTIADFKQEDYDFIFSIALEYVKEIIEAYEKAAPMDAPSEVSGRKPYRNPATNRNRYEKK